MSALERLTPKTIVAAGVVTLFLSLGTSAIAQERAVVVLIDRDSVTHSAPANSFTRQDVNDQLAAVGMRDGLPVFGRNEGKSLRLVTGQSRNAGWHTLTGVPASWKSAADQNDGLDNFVLAGPGLGSGDEAGNRTKFLRDAGVAAMTTQTIRALQGRTLCGVVFQGDLKAAPTKADLTGATLGLVAFRITATDGSSADVEVLDAQAVCSGELTLAAGKAPSP